MKLKIKSKYLNFQTRIGGVLFASLILLSVARPASADLVFCGKRGQDPCQLSDLFLLVYMVVNFLVSMAGLVAIVFIVWGGLQMLLSAGNAAKVQEAKTTVWHAILGLILVVMAYFIVGYVARLFMPNIPGDPIQFFGGFLTR